MAEARRLEIFLATSVSITTAVRSFKNERRHICRHLRWTYSMPPPSLGEQGKEIIWGVLSSTCEECHRACVGLSKATFLARKNYIPLRCAHGGNCGNWRPGLGDHPQVRGWCCCHQTWSLLMAKEVQHGARWKYP